MLSYFVIAILLGQGRITSEARRADAQSLKFTTEAMADRLREADPELSTEQANKDAETLKQAEREGAFNRFQGGESVKIEAAASVWAVIHGTPNKGYLVKLPVTVPIIKKVAQGMGKVIVTSIPDGATITVDGHRWKQSTNAEGYAEAGKVRIVISANQTAVGVECNVLRDGAVTASVDLKSRATSCQ